MTTLYIMRHGDAVSRAPSDRERPLSERGKTEAAAMAKCLLANPPLKLLVSPYLRAQQTASIVLAALEAAGNKVSFETVSYITPEDDPFDAVKKLGELADGNGPVMLVSHNPFVSILLSLLTEGHAQAGLPMATASVACLSAKSFSLGTANLDWYRPPSE